MQNSGSKYLKTRLLILNTEALILVSCNEWKNVIHVSTQPATYTPGNYTSYFVFMVKICERWKEVMEESVKTLKLLTSCKTFRQNVNG